MTQNAHFIGLLVAAALLTSACSGDQQASAPAQTGEGPLVQVVQSAPLSSPGAVQVSGIVGFKRETDLAFNAPGVVAALYVDAGDVVRRGQRLAAQRRTSVGSNANEAALARANAERDLARTQELYERGFVSEARLEDARLAVERARDSSVLTAPADGIILRRRADVSQTIAAGAPIFTFGEPGSGVVVRAPAASAAAGRMQVGDAALVHIAELSDSPRQGRVARIAGQGDAATGAFEIEIEVTQADGLRSGMVASVEIAAAAAPNVENAILVPALALLDARADQGVVFVVDEQSIARRRPVRTAGVTQNGVLIVEGLNSGEQVISAGAAYVRDGEPVRIAAAS